MARSACEPDGGAAVVATNGHTVALDVDADRPRTLEELHASREEVFFESSRDLGVLLRQHLLSAHDQGDLGPERREHVHELDTCHTRSDDDQPPGQLGRRVRVACREDATPVHRRPIGHARTAAGRQDDQIGVQFEQTVRCLDHDVVWALQPRRAVHQPHALALEEVGDRMPQPLFDRVDPSPQRGRNRATP